MSKIYTCHNTALYFDETRSEVRHGSIATSPENLALFRSASEAKLVLKSTQFVGLVQSGSDGALSWTANDSNNVAPFVVVDNDREFGLLWNDQFLSARPDGSFGTAAHLRDWELLHVRNKYQEMRGVITSREIEGENLSFFITDPSDWIAINQLRFGVYERGILELIRSRTRMDRTFVDIGANVGNHSVFMSRLSSVRKIIAFEPNPAAIELLRVNIALNRCTNIDTRYLGLALAGRSAKRYQMLGVHGNLGGLQLSEDSTGPVEGVPGDTFLLDEPVGFLKIDVEGMEFDVLSGLSGTIQRWRPGIFVEVWPSARHRLVDWCAENRYSISDLGGDNFLLDAA